MARIVRHDPRAPSGRAPEGRPPEDIKASSEGTEAPPVSGPAQETGSAQETPGRAGPKILRRETSLAQAEAKAIVEAAKAEAAALLAEAHSQAQAHREAIKAEARAEAAAEGARLLAIAQAEGSALLQKAEGNLTPVVLRACEHLFREEVALDPQRIRAIVEHLLKRCRRDLHRILRVHPDDLPVLAPLAGPLLDLEGDPALHRGDCMLSSAEGHFDARVSVQLERIARALLGEPDPTP